MVVSLALLGINDCADEASSNLTHTMNPTAQTHIICVVPEKVKEVINGF
jgi:hypothetical protein